MLSGSSPVLKQEIVRVICLPDPCALFHMSVFTLHTYIFCERKKLNKSWQFDFPFLKVIFSLLPLAFKSWWRLETEGAQLLPSTSLPLFSELTCLLSSK